MGDEVPLCKVEYTDVDPIEETNWIKRAGNAKVTYPNNHIFEGTFDSEKVKQGEGTYIWMGPASAEDETPVQKAIFKGNFVNGMKTGYGTMTYPNGDEYRGIWFENKMHGEGSYIYKKTGDVYSGSFENGSKSGYGEYMYASDGSFFKGMWVDGDMTTGTWNLGATYATYTGNFKLGRPIGDGKFDFHYGGSQTGTFKQIEAVDGEEEVPEGSIKLPNVEWIGKPVVSF